MTTKRVIGSYELIEKLVAAGVVPENTTRVIIDMDARTPVYIHYTSLGTEDLYRIVGPLAEGATVEEDKP